MELEYQIATNISFNHVIEKIEHLTFPPIRKRIQTMPIHEPYTAVWASRNNKIIGLILADKNKENIAELFSFFVISEERNKGIGSQLLSMLETTLQEQGIKWVQSRYRSDWNSLLYIEKLIAENNWEEPVLFRTITEIDSKMYPHVDWPETKLPSDYSMFDWKELTNKDRSEIDNLLQSGKVPREFNPYQHKDKIFIPGSTGLRYKNQIIGWNIVYALNPDTIEYNNLFVLEEFQNLGHAITLLRRSSRIQYELKIPKSTWVINTSNHPIMKIVMRIFGKHVNKLVEVKASRKILN